MNYEIEEHFIIKNGHIVTFEEKPLFMHPKLEIINIEMLMEDLLK